MAGVALETSLTVGEADRILSALAAKGHLQVTVEHGRLLYPSVKGARYPCEGFGVLTCSTRRGSIHPRAIKGGLRTSRPWSSTR